MVVVLLISIDGGKKTPMIIKREMEIRNKTANNLIKNIDFGILTQLPNL
jgi:hypothetical protein